MTDPIDPRLQYASSLPPRTQSYPAGSALQNNGVGHQPYYLPTPIQQQPPPLSQPAPPGNLDPALEQASPGGQHEGSQDEDEHEHEGDHDGYVIIEPRQQQSSGSVY